MMALVDLKKVSSKSSQGFDTLQDFQNIMYLSFFDKLLLEYAVLKLTSIFS